MSNKALFTFMFVLLSMFVEGQTYLMNSATRNITACRGFFMDSGGSTGNYGSLQNLVTTICPETGSGTHIQLVFSGTQVLDGDELCFYDGKTTSSPSLGCVREFNGASNFIIQATAANASGCVTVTFKSNLFFNGAGWSAEIKCSAACQLINAELVSTMPLASPPDTGWINICPGDVVSFQGKGNYPQNGVSYQHSDNTSLFYWDFGDGTKELGKSASHQFKNPGGYVVQLHVIDQFGCRNTNSVTQRVRVSPKPNFEISSYPAEICSGDTLNLSARVDTIDLSHTVSVIGAEAKFQTQGVRSDSLALPDGTGASYRTTISFSDFSPGQLLNDISNLKSIWVNMEHSWLRDLQIKVTCPNGQAVILHDHPGKLGGEVHLGIPFQGDEGLAVPVPGIGYEYSWSPNPTYPQTWIEYANVFLPSVLPSGSYKSYQPLERLLGCPLNGDWTIEVTDLWAIDNGFIFSWGIAFDPSLYPTIEKFSPRLLSWNWLDNPTVFYSRPDSISGSPNEAGMLTYTFKVKDDFGCAWDTSVQVNVLPINHINCYECKTDKVQLRDTVVCIDEPVRLDASKVLTPIDTVTFKSYPDYAIGFSNHPPANPYHATLDINSVFPTDIGNAVDQIVSVCIDFETDVTRDIHIVLQSPSGQVLQLVSNVGGSGSNFTQTCFTPTALQTINMGTPPFTGAFRPQGSWTVFNNVTANGKWRLLISDAAGTGNFGKLKSWSLTLKSYNSVTYDWSPANLLSCRDCPDPVTTTTSSANYFVTIKDRFGCEIKDTMRVSTIREFLAPTVTCEERLNGEIHVRWNDIHPGASYEVNINNKGWELSNSGLLSHIVRGLKIGDTVFAQVRVAVGRGGCVVNTGSTFCKLELCIAKVVPQKAAPFSVSCNGLCDALIPFEVQNGSFPYTYNYANLTKGTSFTQSTDTLKNLCPGDYKLIMTDNTNCTDSITFKVLEPGPISATANLVSPVSCFGGSDACASVDATGGGGGFTYVWGNPNMSIGKNVCNLPAGKIGVTATDALGCKVVSSVTITQPDTLTLSLAKTDVKCYGQNTGTATVMPVGGNGNYKYQWSGGSAPTAATTIQLVSGNYSVTVVDSKLCQAFANVSIGQPTSPISLSAAQTKRSCYNLDESEVTANISGGVGNYTYLWSPGGQTTRIARNLSPGTYQLTATDANGCTATTTVLAAQWNPVQVSTIEKPPTCHNLANGTVAANFVSGGTGSSYTYKWSNGATKSVVDSLQGGFTYLVTVTDGQGCSGTGSRQLSNPPAISAEMTAIPPKCNGGRDGSVEITAVFNNKGKVSIKWDALSGNRTTAKVDSIRAGTYSVLLTDSLGCNATLNVDVPQAPPLVLNNRVTDNACYGESKGSIDISVSGGALPYAYLWSNGNKTTSLRDLLAGVYRLSVSDANGCLRTDSVRVNQPVQVITTTTIKNATCFGDKNGSILASSSGGSPPYTYSLTGTSFSGSNQFISLAAGNYTVHTKDGKGCVYSTPVAVTQPPPFFADIIIGGLNVDQHLLYSGDTATLVAKLTNNIGKVFLSWEASYCGTLVCNGLDDCKQTPFCQQVQAAPQRSIDYYLLAVDENGCEAKDRLQLHVKKDRTVLVPSAFSPNANGHNDLLTIHGRKGTKILRFRVFDRWGEMLYQSGDALVNDMSFGWDGNFKGRPMQPGVYIWALEIEYSDGTRQNFHGETNLLR